MADALVRLRNTINRDVYTSEKDADSSEPGKKLTKQEFHRHLVKIGLLDQQPETDADSQDLIDQGGEIVDEVVIRERLIEWLTGFLEK